MADTSVHEGSVAVGPGIRRTKYNYLVRVQVRPFPQKAKRFPLTTSPQTMQRWRAKVRGALERQLEGRSTAVLPTYPDPPAMTAENGFCYVYFAEADELVKIGRAINPEQRLREMRVGSPHPLRLLVAVPAHVSLELLIHQRFGQLRSHGEWYRVNQDLLEFIRRLREGMNPMMLFYEGLEWSRPE